MENSEDPRFEKLEALIEKNLAEFRAELKDVSRQIEVKDTQIAALMERLREANTIIVKSVTSNS
jgi:hypothetical protein